VVGDLWLETVVKVRDGNKIRRRKEGEHKGDREKKNGKPTFPSPSLSPLGVYCKTRVI